MISTDQLFKEDSAAFHDVIVEVLIQQGHPKHQDYNITDEQLRAAWDTLPEQVRNIAHCWGLGDTPFRDEAYVYLVKHGLPFTVTPQSKD